MEESVEGPVTTPILHKCASAACRRVTKREGSERSEIITRAQAHFYNNQSQKIGMAYGCQCPKSFIFQKQYNTLYICL